MKIYEELLNIEYDDLNGKNFGPLVVLGYLDEKRSERWYYVKCNICSLDEELYKTGVFLINKAQLLKGGLPCGCSGTPRWNSVNRCYAGILRDKPSVQVFTNKLDAKHFAEQLKEALKLLENRGFNDEIEVTKK